MHRRGQPGDRRGLAVGADGRDLAGAGGPRPAARLAVAAAGGRGGRRSGCSASTPPASVADGASEALCDFLGAATAVLYQLDGQTLQRAGGHAYDPASTAARIAVPDGLAGQVARDRQVRLIGDVPSEHLPVGLGARPQPPAAPAARAADRRRHGLRRRRARLPARRPPSTTSIELLGRVAETDRRRAALGAATAQRLEELLEETQRQAEELQAQQEELRVANEELEEQSRALRESQARLEQQQAELEQTNVQLEEQTQTLERADAASCCRRRQQLRAERRGARARQPVQVRVPGQHVARAAHAAQQLADPGEAAGRQQRRQPDAPSRCKLRADHPLVGQRPADADQRHPRPVEDRGRPRRGASARPSRSQRCSSACATPFEPLAAQKGLALRDRRARRTRPPRIETDRQRLQQILKNLLSNAFKFTEHGERRAAGRSGRRPDARRVRGAATPASASPRDQQEVIFEAFRQADGTTSRKYGGTGLGLSISRELARLLGGDIRVDERARARAARFTLDAAACWPTARAPVAARRRTSRRAGRRCRSPRRRSTAQRAGAHRRRPRRATSPTTATRCSRDGAPAPGRRGRRRASPRSCCDLAHELDFDCVVAPHRRRGAARWRASSSPARIVLDIGLPDQSGLSRARAAQARPGDPPHPGPRRVGARPRADRAASWARSATLLKPVDARASWSTRIQRAGGAAQPARVRRVLIVEDDAALRDSLRAAAGHATSVETVAVGTVAEALEQLRQPHLRLHGARPDAARRAPATSCSRRMAAGRRVRVPAGHRLHRPRAVAATRSSGCAATRSRSSSRARARPSACSTR